MRYSRGVLKHANDFCPCSKHDQVLEETGYNLASQLNPEDVIEVSIREQKISLYVVANVPEDFEFETRTRKEISVCILLGLHTHPFDPASRKSNGSSLQICQRGSVTRRFKENST
jgi:hypothetical protein